MFEITVNGRFIAHHQLHTPDGTWEPLHEHVWAVTVGAAGPRLNRHGILADFGHLRRELVAVLGTLDRRTLNRLPAFRNANPSAENVARFVAQQLTDAVAAPARLAWVEVEEEPGCKARYFVPRPRRTRARARRAAARRTRGVNAR
jgi:6-pyruvoyltetrahydropterin/6-carboxytetrahydropterin synthase